MLDGLLHDAAPPSIDLGSHSVLMDVFSHAADTSALGSGHPVDGGMMHSFNSAVDSAAPANDVHSVHNIAAPVMPIVHKIGGLFG